MTDDAYDGNGNRDGCTSDDFHSFNGIGRADSQAGTVTHQSVTWHDFPLCGWDSPNDRTSADTSAVTCKDCLDAVTADAARVTSAPSKVMQRASRAQVALQRPYAATRTMCDNGWPESSAPSEDELDLIRWEGEAP